MATSVVAALVTHGVTAVAELKQDGDAFSDKPIAVTHGVTAVAELKLATETTCVRRFTKVTHGVTAVAELKLSSCCAIWV